MTTEHRIRSSGISALLVTALFFLGSACAQSTSSQNTASPSVAPSASAVAFAPAGGPVPDQLLGDWYLPTAAVDAAVVCDKPVTASTCRLSLNLSATKYKFAGTRPSSPGEVVVNNTEIDFFNAAQCAQQGLEGVGRYTWTFPSGVLHLAPLNNDPCGRSAYLANQSFYRTI
jgi:hypothetical protein